MTIGGLTVKIKILSATLLMTSALAMAALAPSAVSARVLTPGNYNLGGVQNICPVGDGTWYGETFGPWGGQWKAGPAREDATLIFGNYQSGFGNSALVVAWNKTADWTDWTEDFNPLTTSFLEITVTPIAGGCLAPFTRVNAGGHRSPMD